MPDGKIYTGKLAPENDMTQETRTKAASRGKTSTAGTGSQFLQHYQAAIQLLQQGRTEKALPALEKLLADAPPDLRERCQMYLTACRRQLAERQLVFTTPEERYDYAISQLNTGYYEEAREQFDAILAEHSDADYVYYGLALLDALTGLTQDCLMNLARAIELNPRNRLQARSDTDFQSMVDDPRFTELLYPEIP
jgi:tetratricopeptide (TPR) repeat protein